MTTGNSLPEVMVTASLVRRARKRRLSSEWLAAVRMPGDMYAFHHHVKSEGKNGTDTARILGIRQTYNNALLLLEHFELGADDSLRIAAKDFEALHFAGNHGKAGLLGQSLKRRSSYTLEAGASLDNHTHYSLFAPQLGDIQPAPRMHLNQRKRLTKLFASLHLLMDWKQNPLNRVRTRTLVEEHLDEKSGTEFSYSHFEARQDPLSLLWSVDYITDGRTSRAFEPNVYASDDPSFTTPQMWDVMKDREKRILDVAHKLPERLSVERNPWKHRDKFPVPYFGRFLPSIIHEILAREDVGRDRRRDPVIENPARNPRP